MANYWSYSKKKMTKPQIKKAHKRAKKLMKYKDKIKSPYALAMWQIKKKDKKKVINMYKKERVEHPTFSRSQVMQIVKDHQKK